MIDTQTNDTRTFATTGWPVVGLVILMLVSLTIMSRATEDSAQFGQLYSILLIVNTLGLVGLGVLIVWNLIRLIRQVRAQQAGARLTARMVAIFALLSVTPVLIVYLFSLQFLQRGIDTWFDVRIEVALKDALSLGQIALDGQMRDRLKQVEVMAIDLAGMPNDSIAGRLNDSFGLSGATELTVMTSRGSVIAASTDATELVPNRPDEAVLLQLRQGGSYIGLDPVGDSGLYVRAAARVPGSLDGNRRFLHALFAVDDRMSVLADSVQAAFAKYRELVYLREPLKRTFVLTLSLVLVFSLLSAVWAAFFFARRMVAPLRSMASATLAVADGDYEGQLPVQSSDELGFLVTSFNNMTRRLSRARDETRLSQQQVEAQRTYLEAVLLRLSSGVITTDVEQRLYTANTMAGQILGVELEQERGSSLSRLERQYSHLSPLVQLLQSHAHDTAEDWREEVILLGPAGRQILMCRGTHVGEDGGAQSNDGKTKRGQLIVFDDLTTLIEAQRNQTWSEVARRLAHEIKNPLTPIQLSAERLRHKYLRHMAEEDVETFDRLTRTIVQQVDAMKNMVNDFSNYARTPERTLQALDLNQLVRDVTELYRTGNANISVSLEDGLPVIYADGDRLRQVLHNLIKNAAEACPKESAKITVETHIIERSSRPFIELRVADNGAGIETKLLERLFEPYVSSKPKGTGLGLAIVRKIVEEHSGIVWAENLSDGGARFVLQLPATTESERQEAIVNTHKMDVTPGQQGVTR
jgi:nitrogen fixation/metabolism regulation signal transduction histidine kinase